MKYYVWMLTIDIPFEGICDDIRIFSSEKKGLIALENTINCFQQEGFDLHKLEFQKSINRWSYKIEGSSVMVNLEKMEIE